MGRRFRGGVMGKRRLHGNRGNESRAFRRLAIAGEGLGPPDRLAVMGGRGFAKSYLQGNAHKSSPQAVGKGTSTSVTSEGRASRVSSEEKVRTICCAMKGLGISLSGCAYSVALQAKTVLTVLGGEQRKDARDAARFGSGIQLPEAGYGERFT